MKKIAIVYMAHDGFTSLYTGVGSVARDFLLSFPHVYKNLKSVFKNYSFNLYATTIKYDKNCFGFSEKLKKETLAFVKKNKNIHLIELLNGSNADESYATIQYWKFASISGATFIYTLSLKYNQVVLVAVDTPFAQVANYFFKQYKFKNVKIVWLPQSTVLIHREKTESLTKEEKERYNWEKKIIDLSSTNKNVFIGCVGDFMKRHLLYEYSARPSRLISIRNSLYLDRLKSLITSQNKIETLLKRLGIPTNRPILFSFGRAEYYKGFNLILSNCSDLIKEKDFFIVVLCSPYGDNKNDPVVKTLKEFEYRNNKDVKIISTQNFLIPHLIMQWRKTNILALLSRAEPFGLIPIEARFYRNKNLVLVVSNIGGLPEQIEEGVDGFITNLDSTSIKKTLMKTAELSAKERELIAINAYDKILSNYDQVKIDTEFISTVLNLK